MSPGLVIRGSQRLGILGGGQLAKMLAEAAIRQGIEPTVLVSGDSDPAAIDGARIVVGGLDEPAAISELAKLADVLTLENEFIDLKLLGRGLRDHPRARLLPEVRSIATAQDKLAQRRLFQELGIPIAPFTVVSSGSLVEDLRDARERFADGFVLKWSRFGYDGRGNLLVRPYDGPELDEIAEFCRRGEARGATVYAERMVDFACELAIVMTRASDGDRVFYPLVITRQERGVCREVLGPAQAAGYAADLETNARTMAERIATALELTGTLAVEFFLDKDGQLLVNELAPRVHNSGHYTLFGDAPSQFDLHVQAVSGLPLSRPRLTDLVVMRNILGPWTIRPRTLCPPPSDPAPAGTSLTWYGKQHASPGRKMGHLTGRAPTLESANDMLDAMADYEARYWTTIHARDSVEVA